MEINKDYWVTYKYYDSKNRRQAVFSRKINNNTLEIFILSCSIKDPFKKDCAKMEYGFYLHFGKPQNSVHPKIFTIPIQDGNGPKYEMLKWCRSNLYTITEQYIPIKVLTAPVSI